MENKKGKNDLTSEEEKALFSNLEFSYSRSKEEVWNSLDKIMGEQSEDIEEQFTDTTSQGKDLIELPGGRSKRERTTKVISINWKTLSVAASLLILISAGFFVRFYSRSVSVAPGEFVSHTLPDGSEVHLNAATSISYNPYWWRFKRSVRLEGEAYFVVAKGEKFSVHAALGTTEVLGTEFNVYARGDDFQVYCEEGRVKVRSSLLIKGAQDSTILTKGQLAILTSGNSNTTLVKQTDAVPNTSILAWRVGKFIYNNTPLDKVFEELERHYGVELILDDITIEDQEATASFSRSVQIESALDVICGPNGLVFTKTKEGVYLIKRG